METVPSNFPDALNGWKEIAGFLGKSARTVQRWERDLGLPVHRIPTPDGGSIVFARRAELSEWRARQAESAASLAEAESELADPNGAGPPLPDAAAPIAPPTSPNDEATAGPWWRRPVPMWATVGAVAVAAAVTIAVDRIRDPGTPASLEFEGRQLWAYSDGGRPLWTHTFDRVASRPESYKLQNNLSADVDGDGSTEIVAGVRFAAPRDSSDVSDAVVAFSADGSVVWSVQPDVTLTEGDKTFTGPWQVRDVVTGMSARGHRTWIAYSHHTWWPAFVLEVEPDGSAHVRYLQAGRIHSLTYWDTSGKRYLVAGGAMLQPSRASVAVMDLDGPAARWPVDKGPALTCDACPGADPVAMLLVPTAEVTRALFRPYGWVLLGTALGSEITMATDDGFGWGSLLTFNDEFKVTAFERSDMYWQAHQDLERQGRLTHPAHDCPDRTALFPVEIWRGTAGWGMVEVPLRVSLADRAGGL
ncbi:MAG: hypothetical protein AB7H93_09700 [Vicinamibacterales bacterium]